MMIAVLAVVSTVKMLKILISAKISMPAANAMFMYLMIGNGSVTKSFFSDVLLAVVLLLSVVSVEVVEEELSILIIN
jgi:hypothetical protein